ncbi:MAG: ABC transporter substrate-binding protein [archaeon]|nr:ABC transporter substrate-binding protein [archaeon]
MDSKKILAIVLVVVVIAAAAAAVVLMGNNNDDKKDDPIDPADPIEGEITITDLDGKTYTFDKTLSKVVLGYSCSGGPFMTLAALLGKDLPKYLVGVDNSIYQYRTDIYNAFCKDVPGFKDLEKVGGVGAGFDPAYVATLGTEAFITSIHHKQTVINNGVDTAFAKLGIPTIYIDFLSEDVDKATESVKLLGTLFGKESRAKDISDYYAGKVNAVTDKAAQLLKDGTITRSTMYLEPFQFGIDKLGTSQGNDYLFGRIAYLCGADSICNESSSTLEAAYVLTKDPENIIVLGSDWNNGNMFLNLGFGGNADDAEKTINEIFNGRTGWSDLQAYKNGNVFALNMSLSREIWDFAGFEYIASSLYPEHFTCDAESDLKDFFNKFLPVKFDGTWFFSLKDNTPEYETVTVTTNDSTGQITQTYTKAPTRIIAGNDTALELLLYLGLGEYIVGVYYDEDEISPVVKAEYDALKGRLDSKYFLSGLMSQAVATELEPDFIIGYKSSFGDGQWALGSTQFWNKIDCNVMSLNTQAGDRTVNGLIQDYTDIGKIFDISGKTTAFIKEYQALIDSVKGIEANGTIAIMEKSGDNWSAYGDTSFVGQELIACGGTNAFPGGKTVSDAQVIDGTDITGMVLIAFGSNTPEALVESVLSNPNYANVPAVINKNIYCMGLSGTYGGPTCLQTVKGIVDVLKETTKVSSYADGPITITTNDTTGQITQTYTKAPTRIIAGNDTALELLLYLGLGEYIVGVYYDEDEISPVVKAEYDALKGRLDSKYFLSGLMSQAVATELEPDFIIGYKSSFGDGQWALGSTQFWNKIDCNVMSLNTQAGDRTVNGLIQDYTDIGKIFDISGKTTAFIKEYQALIDSVKGIEANGTIAIMEKSGDNWSAYGDTSFVGQELIACGGTNAFPGGKTVSDAQVIDGTDITGMVLIAFGSNTPEALVESVLSNPNYANVPAVINKNIYCMGLSGTYGGPTCLQTVKGIVDVLKATEDIKPTFNMDEVEKNITNRLLMYGNATHDDVLDETDIAMIQAIIDGTVTWDKEKFYLADANTDGVIDAKDVEQVKKLINNEETIAYYIAYDGSDAYIHYPNTGKIAVTADYGMMIAQVAGIYDRVGYAVDKLINNSSEGRYPGIKGFTSVGTYSKSDVPSFTDTILSHSDITLVLGSLSLPLNEALVASGAKVDHLLLSASAQQDNPIYNVVGEMLTACTLLSAADKGLEYVAYMDSMEAYLAENTAGMDPYTFVCAYNTTNDKTTYVDTTGANGAKFGDVWTLSHLPMVDIMPANGNGYYQVEIESILLDYNPDVIIISMWNVATDASDPADVQKVFEERAAYFKYSKAYQNGMVFGVNYEIYGTCIGVSGLALLASYIWPDTFDEATGWDLLQQAINQFTLLDADVHDCGGLICYKLNQ